MSIKLNIGTVAELFADCEDEILLSVKMDTEQIQSGSPNKSMAEIYMKEEDDELCLNVSETATENKPSGSKIPENMIHLVRNSKKEIKRNKLIAKIRLVEGKIPWIAKFKNDMSDYFFPIESWPNYAIEIVLTRDFSYGERIGLATFLHGNGLNDKDKALQIFQMYNNSWKWDRRWKIKFEKFQCLFVYLDQIYKVSVDGPRLKSEYWYYDMNLNLTMFYDGNVRTNRGE